MHPKPQTLIGQAGASVLHDVNVYSVSTAKQHKLKMKHGVTKGLTAVFYNGTGTVWVPRFWRLGAQNPSFATFHWQS